MLFTMTFDHPEWGLVVHDRSLDGECWEQTFLRLYQSVLPDGSTPRRIVDAERRGTPCGASTNMVTAGYTDGSGGLVRDRPVLIRTRPPQF